VGSGNEELLMANYNTFVVVDCKSRNILLVTSSARLASTHLKKGIRIEVWNGNLCTEKIYDHTRKREKYPLSPYIQLEKDHIRRKQARAEKRNSRKRMKVLS
jgi:hypothetical protein